eukprot:scaffold22396_cov56-Phaeocystis_antarctica.AAC.4
MSPSVSACPRAARPPRGPAPRPGAGRLGLRSLSVSQAWHPHTQPHLNTHPPHSHQSCGDRVSLHRRRASLPPRSGPHFGRPRLSSVEGKERLVQRLPALEPKALSQLEVVHLPSPLAAVERSGPRLDGAAGIPRARRRLLCHDAGELIQAARLPQVVALLRHRPPVFVLGTAAAHLLDIVLGHQLCLAEVLHAHVVVAVEGAQPVDAVARERSSRVGVVEEVLLPDLRRRPSRRVGLAEERKPILLHVLGTAHESQRVAAQEVDAAVGQVCGEARDAVVDGAEEGKRGLAGQLAAVAARQLVDEHVQVEGRCGCAAGDQVLTYCRLPQPLPGLIAFSLKADRRVPRCQEARDRIAHPRHDLAGIDACGEGR